MKRRLLKKTDLVVLSVAAFVATAALPCAAEDPPVAAEAANPAESPAPDAGAADHDALLRMAREIAELREQFRQLQETLDLLVGQIMADMERENAELRQEVRRLHARYGPELVGNMPPVPRPGGALIDEVLAEGLPEPATEPEPEPLPEAVEVPAEFGLTVVDEWGRTPEVAAEIGGDATSLKGMAGLVPPGSAPEDLETLALQLRAQYAEYDNINIEIFDDPAAAQSYIDSNVSDSEHRVLSISKHRASGRDLLLRIENGVPIEIPF